MKKDVKALTKLALIIGLLLDYIDEIEYNKWWFQKLKNIGTRFKKELEKHDNIMIGGVDAKTSQDFVNSYESISKLLDFNLELDESELNSFDEDLEKLINKYKNK